ncbi:aminoglycoside 3'-phosphotransferase [Sporosarcina thermotolerans]|uniref:Aminoglycoside 3'-phosphotransferase n=1 Tax=Sporosarcina thermotolerans TaxID=633404 RepID=A0AAW9A802_9BACL|nr:APH(3') family aminoglycoside O-phosphotransferase [Sporosarcina thermotolerans]MDW0117164.1 aminoglycoside 3'-phosphotransferase [Sporosarcina thermotolerans]WHT47336.1 aminoglycoside 3'-phosphotransferase [Sporosarcina thermotolerans]
MIEIPSSLAKLTNGFDWEPITIGHSQSMTFLLKGSYANQYLKVQSVHSVERLFDEKEKMKWLEGKLPVPRVLFYEMDEAYEYLLMSEIKGVNASDQSHRGDLPAMLESLGDGLKAIHCIRIDDCPFIQSLGVKVEEAKNRVANGLVDEDDFDEVRMGRKAIDLYEELVAKRPLDEELVFTHGDYCLPNVIMENQRVSGFIDWGRAGVADIYQDLALAIRSISSNFGKEYVPFFLEGYGITELDESKVEFYQLMDEFY